MVFRPWTAHVCAFAVPFGVLFMTPERLWADEVCVAPSVVASLSSCSAEQAARPRASHTPRPPISAPETHARKAPTLSPPDAPTAVEVRRKLTAVRAQQLLITQIQGLESLLSATPPDSSSRPDLLRRLGDAYVELEASTFQKMTESRIEASAIQKKSAARAAELGKEADKAEQIELKARKAAIRYYGELAAHFPKWCQSSATGKGCLDETLYNLAYEHEQSGDVAEARKAYLHILQKIPTSKYVGKAYLAFGELFFQEAQADPSKWTLAEQSYQEVVKLPPPDNTAYGYAHYKLGHVYWNMGDAVRAMTEFKKTIEYGMSFPTLPGATALATSARRDILPVYAQAGQAGRAYEFFVKLSGSDASRTRGILEDLGRGYLDVGHYQDAVTLYRDLAQRFPGEKRCAYQARMTEAVLAQHTGDKAASKAALDQLFETENRFRKENYSAADKQACANETASQVLETAMMWHLEVVGSGGVRGTLDPKTRAFAGELYEKALARFSAADFAGFTFPRLVREDWPTLLTVKVAHADLLYSEGNWKLCGPAFDAVVAEDPKGPQANEASYASALCHQKAYLAAHAEAVAHLKAGADVQKPRPLTEDEQRMMGSFDRFLCIFKPAPNDKEAYERYVDVAFARARTFFEARHFEEAAAAFRAIAFQHADTEAGAHAAELALEALNVLSKSKPAACHSDLAEATAKLLDLYCKAPGQGSSGPSEACVGFRQVKSDVTRAIVEDAIAKAGDGSTPESSRRLEEGANGYLAIWNEEGRAACAAKQPGCKRMDEVLYNAALAFQKARLLGKAIGVRKMMLDPHFGLDHGPLAAKVMLELGRNYQAIAVYDEAAFWYERFAKEASSAGEAPSALEDAILLRLSLGQEEAAATDVEIFERAWGSKHKALSAQIAFAIGAHDVDKGEFDKAERRLSRALSDIDQKGTIDVKVQAHALLGRAYAQRHRVSLAAKEYARVQELLRDPKQAQSLLGKTEGDARVERRMGKMLLALGEATFFAAEQKRALANAIHFPAYKGSGRRDDVLAHIRTKVHDWMENKRRAIEEAEREYLKILAIEPSPPPWVIAAGARTGHLWGKFVAEFRAAPIPKEWLQHGPSPYGDLTWDEIRAAYYEAIDVASEPYRQRAKAAFKKCLDYSVTYQYADEHSRSCETWLAQNYATEFSRMDEIRAAPTRSPSTMTALPVAIAR